VIPADIEEKSYDMDEISKKLEYGEPVVLTSIFMKCGSSVFQELLDRRNVYTGKVITDKNEHEIRIILKQCDKYIREIEKLYRVYQFNGIEWNTINFPYAYKFIDIVLDSTPVLEQGEKIIEISIDLAEYERYKVIDAVPLWNIKQIETDDRSFPSPAIDRINYDHTIALENYGIQNGYLIESDNPKCIYIKRLERELIVVSPDGDQHSWKVLQVENFENKGQKSYAYELLSNKRKLGFIGRYLSVKAIVVRTEAEIARLVQSYELAKELMFVGVEIKEGYDKKPMTINYNGFVDDNIRIDSYKKIMLLLFRSDRPGNYLIYDKMSFLISEIQMLFPEYKCIGELV
jgi:hypothetical protein